jgi:hypothetical protein
MLEPAVPVALVVEPLASVERAVGPFESAEAVPGAVCSELALVLAVGEAFFWFVGQEDFDSLVAG